MRTANAETILFDTMKAELTEEDIATIAATVPTTVEDIAAARLRKKKLQD